MRASLWIVGLVFLNGCAATPKEPGVVKERPLTLGLVQREIHPGMTSGAVAEVLGPPNLVSKEAAGGERWVYDKTASEESSSDGGAQGTLILFGGFHNTHQAAQTERTLTIVITFTEKNLVEAVSYHASRF